MNQKHNGKWKPVELGEIIDIFDSIRVPLNSRQRAERQGRFPYYGASGIIDSVDDFLFDGEYVLVAEDGENLNSRKLPVAFMARGQFWVNNHAHIIKGKKGVADDRFLISWFAQADIKGYITGAAQPKLSQANLKRIALTAPPYPTQRKIAGVLSAYDDLIENNTRRIAILEEMAQAIYREWFVNFRFPGHEKVKLINSPLGKIPEGWKVSPLKEVYRTSSGGTPSRKVDEYYEGGSINWVKTKELKDRFIWETEEKITEEGLANSSAKVFPANTVIMAMYGATIGQLGILGAEATTNQACCGFLTSQSSYGYPYLFLNLLTNRTDIINLRAGAAQQNVSQDVIREIPFLVPSLPIVQAFNDLVEPFLQGVLRLQKKNSNLTRTRDLLLPKLISGQLDVEELDIDTGEPLVEAVA